MKKLLLILLLLILPLQYSWSAAAVYCQHESNSSFHFGHHVHQHKAAADDSKAKSKLPLADSDCEYCHLFSHAFLLPFESWTAATPVLSAFISSPIRYSSTIPARPPRPNWLRVA